MNKNDPINYCTFCPICNSPQLPEELQPIPSLHISGQLFKCGFEVLYPIGSDIGYVEKLCGKDE